MDYFVSCPGKIEELLAQELQDLGGEVSQRSPLGVYVSGDISLAYKICLHSRFASRVVLLLKSAAISTAEQLYEATKEVPWEEHIAEDQAIRVVFTGKNQHIKHSGFGALKVKDAIVDRMREVNGSRPDVSQQHSLSISAHLRKGQLQLGLDLSGESLHRRGYRVGAGAAPLKENLAAAILQRAAWPKQGGYLVDPMCGSGTFLIEAAYMALDIAPGVERSEFGFDYWLGHQTELWQPILEAAQHHKQEVLAGETNLCLLGFDEDSRVLRQARHNVQAAGLDSIIKLQGVELTQLASQLPELPGTGLVICNPPYGERLGELEQLEALYQQLGDLLKQSFAGWQAMLLFAEESPMRQLGLAPQKRYKFENGAIPCLALRFDVRAEAHRQLYELSESAPMLVNRLKKNQKQLKRWLKREQISCYRLYDADMPEYAVAIDIYHDWAHVQEYTAPKTIKPQAAATRLQDVLKVLPEVLAMPKDRIVLKQRQQQKGKQQYQKLNDEQQRLEVAEGNARLWVNLHDYLDTGLFLDHRPLRRLIAQDFEQWACGGSFLNLFSYTATATVHAALAGAASSVSVDASNTYTRWAQDNFVINNLNPYQHHAVRADCISWLTDQDNKFDVIMLDPPSFSNSKSREESFDIQRDHVALIKAAMVCLKPQGKLYFSGNLRKFKIDLEGLEGLQLTDLGAKSIDPDFARRSNIHFLWQIQHS